MAFSNFLFNLLDHVSSSLGCSGMIQRSDFWRIIPVMVAKLECPIVKFIFCWQDVSFLTCKGQEVLAAGMAELYPPETRDIEILDCCAGTGKIGQEVR